MSTIAGEGTNLGEREVTTTGQEREKTDEEMTGTTGSGTEAGNDGAEESTGITTEVVGRDSPHQGMT